MKKEVIVGASGLGLVVLLVGSTGCQASTGTKVTAASAADFVENAATRAQVSARFGEPDNTTSMPMPLPAPGGGMPQMVQATCDNYIAGSASAFSGASSSTQAMFCYNERGLLVKKQIIESANR